MRTYDNCGRDLTPAEREARSPSGSLCEQLMHIGGHHPLEAVLRGMQLAAQDVMKRKAMEIEKSKIESARTGKAGTSAYAPSNMSSITINNNRSATDLDLTPTFSR